MRSARSLATAAAVVAVCALPRAIAAQIPGLGPMIVLDPSNLARNAAQLAQQIQAVQAAKQQLTYQLQALKKLPNPPLRDINATMAALRSVMATGDALVYAAHGVDAQLRTTFPLDKPFTAFPLEQQAQAARTVATMRAAVAAAAAQAGTFAAGQDRVNAMQAAVRGVQWHLGALDLLGSSSFYQAQELLLLRQALAAQTNVQAVQNAYQVNREVQQDASMRALYARMAATPARRAPLSLGVVP